MERKREKIGNVFATKEEMGIYGEAAKNIKRNKDELILSLIGCLVEELNAQNAGTVTFSKKAEVFLKLIVKATKITEEKYLKNLPIQEYLIQRILEDKIDNLKKTVQNIDFKKLEQKKSADKIKDAVKKYVSEVQMENHPLEEQEKALKKLKTQSQIEQYINEEKEFVAILLSNKIEVNKAVRRFEERMLFQAKKATEEPPTDAPREKPKKAEKTENPGKTKKGKNLGEYERLSPEELEELKIVQKEYDSLMVKMFTENATLLNTKLRAPNNYFVLTDTCATINRHMNYVDNSLCAFRTKFKTAYSDKMGENTVFLFKKVSEADFVYQLKMLNILFMRFCVLFFYLLFHQGVAAGVSLTTALLISLNEENVEVDQTFEYVPSVYLFEQLAAFFVLYYVGLVLKRALFNEVLKKKGRMLVITIFDALNGLVLIAVPCIMYKVPMKLEAFSVGKAGLSSVKTIGVLQFSAINLAVLFFATELVEVILILSAPRKKVPECLLRVAAGLAFVWLAHSFIKDEDMAQKVLRAFSKVVKYVSLEVTNIVAYFKGG